MIGVVVYDDHKPRRESLQALVEMHADMKFLAGFANCDNVENDMQTYKPNIVLMDIEMPGTDGLEGVKRIKANFPEIKIIMQTAFEDNDKIFESLQWGAEGYILKKAGIATIEQCIRDVHNGGAFMTPSVALRVMKHFGALHKPSAQISGDDARAETNLSSKELEVLQHLSSGMSYKMVADKLGISYFTVNNHVKKIYQKLHVHSLGEAVSFALKNKLV